MPSPVAIPITPDLWSRVISPILFSNKIDVVDWLQEQGAVYIVPNPYIDNVYLEFADPSKATLFQLKYL